LVEKALNHLAKKLSGEEGEAKNKQRVIHDLAANGLEANPYVINTIKKDNETLLMNCLSSSKIHYQV
jgi:hypothetical protein